MAIVLNRLTVLDAVRMLQRRELSAVQLMRACFARIEQREDSVHAWAALDKDAALAHAQALDNGPITGPLHGLPFGVKDVFDTQDLPTTYGSPIYRDHRPDTDAAAVTRCRQAGALVAGKTVSTEFATFKAPPTRNPHNTAYTPGGSSSGSAAAVADCMVPFALGTQTAASIIRPAAYCGVVGFKPTFGAIPREGVKVLAPSLDTVGCFTRTVDDAALVASVLMDKAELRRLDYDGPPRIGIYRTPQWRHTLPETRDAMAHAIETLARAKAVVQEVDLLPECCSLVQLQSDIMAYEAARSLAAERESHASQISAGLQALLQGGDTIDEARHQANLRRAQDLYGRLGAWFDRFDVLLTPSAPGEAPFADQGTGDPLFGRVWTMFGLPSVHLPFMNGPHGLPVGLQAVGPRGHDHRLLCIAKWMHDKLRPQA
ncbi:amidase [Bordetella bronchialis]|uniref:Amidase n=1 Tax=Bordetella bronchialis TaxID=463025 RepID=A0A193FB44_9BORD|nr:amidase [Bordetella bronchialis]ANN65007.1 amidase [Bordetella bronchialis]ANN70038.1 amidase [Bordetella bronchialis]